MKRFFLAALFLFLSACSSPEPVDILKVTDDLPALSEEQIDESPLATSAVPTADVIFYGGTILTMDDESSAAQALAIKGDKIIAVGSDQEVLTSKGENTILIALEGKTLMPGFVDAHTHLLNDSSYFGTTLEGVQQMALENGITTLGNMYTSQDFLEQMQTYNDQNGLRVRVSLYLNYNSNCGEVFGTWWKDVPPTREPGEMLRIGGVKIFTDGGSCNRPALSYETVPGAGLGDLYLSADQLASIVIEAQEIGHQVAIHALGDRAIETTLDGVEAALGGQPNTYRHRIEHNAILRPDLLPRYSEVGVVATIFASFMSCIPFDNPSPDPYKQWEWAWPSLIEANPELHIAWHGDDPYMRPVNPLLELYGFITRNQAEDDRLTVCEPPEWIKDDTLSVDQALAMMTRESAYALFRDEEVGSLTPGKFADLIILSANPLTENPETLLDTYVLVTLVGGKVEFCADGSEELCPTVPTPAPPSTPESSSIPFGYVDNPSAEERVSGNLSIFGWALDDRPIEQVKIYLDGDYIGDAFYGDPRPDVANDYPGRADAPDFGFSFQLDTTLFANGPHTITVLAFSVSGNQGTLYPETFWITVEN